MDEDLTIISQNTRIEKIKNFLIKNRKILIYVIIFCLLTLIIFFGYNEYEKKEKKNISDLYNSTLINYSDKNKEITLENLINIIDKKDATYSPLSLYFILDNQLINEKDRVNNLFDILLEEISLEKEIKNLIIYKKGLYNADISEENELLDILNPIIKSKSIWKSHALYLMAEFYYFKNEKQKSKEFFNLIISLNNANQNILIETQKRLNRDFSE